MRALPKSFGKVLSEKDSERVKSAVLDYVAKLKERFQAEAMTLTFMRWVDVSWSWCAAHGAWAACSLKFLNVGYHVVLLVRAAVVPCLQLYLPLHLTCLPHACAVDALHMHAV